MNKIFKLGEVWLSPRNYFYKVVAIEGEHVILRMGVHGKGKKIKRRADITKNWSLHIEG